MFSFQDDKICVNLNYKFLFDNYIFRLKRTFITKNQTIEFLMFQLTRVSTYG